jgi:FKBP-type peptidyl-prolyl cis-trans isomerase
MRTFTFRAMALVAVAIGVSGCKPPEVSVTETPIIINDEVRGGYGAPIDRGDKIRMDYVIKLPGGGVVLRQEDYVFVVGTGSVIRGVDEAVIGMRQGGMREFTCPPHKHWGRAGYGDGIVPPATDLHVRLLIVSVESRGFRRRTVASGGPEQLEGNE